MKITDIKQQLKRHDRYSIYIDGKYSFSLSEGELLSQKLSIGQEFDTPDFLNIQEVAESDKAYSKCIDLISRRQRSNWEIEQYLKRKRFKDEVIIETIKKLVMKNYIDDKSFATSWLNSRRQIKSSSSKKIRLELMQKHVDQKIIDEILLNEDVDEVALIKQTIDKKKKQTRYSEKEKLIAYLLRQGFNYGDIKSALNEDN